MLTGMKHIIEIVPTYSIYVLTERVSMQDKPNLRSRNISCTASADLL